MPSDTLKTHEFMCNFQKNPGEDPRTPGVPQKLRPEENTQGYCLIYKEQQPL